MRAVVQRALSASVSVNGRIVGSCGHGLVAFVAAHRTDTDVQAVKLAGKIATLRIMADSEGKMNLSIEDLPVQDEPRLLAVSNFTVYGDASSQRRPSFMEAAPYETGSRLFDAFVAALRERGLTVETGEFGADMRVEVVNDGPVTIVVEVGTS